MAFNERTLMAVEKEKYNCVYAVEQGLGEIITNFRNIPDEYISERANDIEDIKNRIISNMTEYDKYIPLYLYYSPKKIKILLNRRNSISSGICVIFNKNPIT